MSTRTFHGSCHCGAIKFEADLDLDKGTGKCNCTYCWKVRNWSMTIKPDAFRLLSGKDMLGDYTKHPAGHHGFCKTCGVRTHSWGDIPEIGGPFVSVALAALDDLPAAELIGAPVRHANGRDNDWFNVPAEIRHL
ncbi:MAG: GFA family protein [Kofleriaceae bacterium]